MIDVNSKRFRALVAHYKAATGNIFPMEMISHTETYENLDKYNSMCEKENRDVLPEIYGWDLSGNIIY